MTTPFNPLEQRPFGIELEVSRRLTKLNNSDRINSNGWAELLGKVDYLRQHGKIDRRWKLKTDTSCGGEIVSPPFHGAAAWKEIAMVCDAARYVSKKTLQPVVDGECGLHLHFDASDFDALAFSNLFIITQMAEVLFYIMYPNRRLEYCAPISLNMKQVGRFRDLTDVRDAWYRRENNKREPEKSYSSEFICSQNPGDRYDGTRYHGLNIHCYWQIGTVEFRYCEGTFDPLHILAWYELCLAIVNTSVYYAKQKKVIRVDDYLSTKSYDWLRSHFMNNGRTRKLVSKLANLCGLSRRAICLIMRRIRRTNATLLMKNPPKQIYIDHNSAVNFCFRDVESGNIYNSSGNIASQSQMDRKKIIDVILEDSPDHGKGYKRIYSADPLYLIEYVIPFRKNGNNFVGFAGQPPPAPLAVAEDNFEEVHIEQVIGGGPNIYTVIN